MTLEQLEEFISNMEIGDNYNVRTSTFTFGLKCMELIEGEVIVFGGYGTHYTTLDRDVYEDYEIAEEIEKHVSGYHSDIEGESHITLEEFRIINAD